MSVFAALLAAHIALAISLFLPSFLLPFALPARRGAPVTAPTSAGQGRFVRGLLWLQGDASLTIGLGVGLTGVGLIAILGASVLSQPWLLAGLVLYALNLGVAFFVQRPALRRLLGLRSGASEEEQERWRVLARRQRYLSYLMAGAIGTIAFLMTAKPGA